MKPLSNKTLETSKIIFLSLLLGLGINYIFAAPPTPPICPNNVDGCNAPLNVGYTSQIKQGNLDIKGLTSAGVSALNGLIVENGNVGIGTMTPAGLLDVNGKLTVLANGNVGIGTTTPIRGLQVNGGEISITRSDGYAYINVSDPNGNGGGTLVLRGLTSNGAVEANANVSVVGELSVNGVPFAIIDSNYDTCAGTSSCDGDQISFSKTFHSAPVVLVTSVDDYKNQGGCTRSSWDRKLDSTSINTSSFTVYSKYIVECGGAIRKIKWMAFGN